MKLTKIAAALLVMIFATSCGTLVLNENRSQKRTQTVVVQKRKEAKTQKRVTRQTQKQEKKDAKSQQKQNSR